MRGSLSCEEAWWVTLGLGVAEMDDPRPHQVPLAGGRQCPMRDRQMLHAERDWV